MDRPPPRLPSRSPSFSCPCPRVTSSLQRDGVMGGLTEGGLEDQGRGLRARWRPCCPPYGGSPLPACPESPGPALRCLSIRPGSVGVASALSAFPPSGFLTLRVPQPCLPNGWVALRSRYGRAVYACSYHEARRCGETGVHAQPFTPEGKAFARPHAYSTMPLPICQGVIETFA